MKLNELNIDEASPLELLKRKLSPAMHANQYEKAAETMYNILQRKRKETGGKLRHGLGYYAMDIGGQFRNVNYRALMKYFIDKYPEYRKVFGESELNELKIEIPDDEGMGIPRSRMPQIKSSDYPEFIDYLADNGATFEKETVPARSLKPVQKEFSKAGVEKQMQKKQDGKGKKPIIASSDDYIMDGHHRWLVGLNTGGSVDIYRVNKPGKELLDLLLAFPKVYFKDIYNEAGVGKITKQNTTADVKPGETERQAKKFFGGNGKPKPLGVKGATPNQAFNLGLTEGYKLQLERGDDMDVLHITDTTTGKRTEVRGKPDYERAYDPTDKLHQLLDKIGKASNVSDLINGEVVGINPKHPDGASAKKAADIAYNENISVTGTARGKEAKRKKLVPGSEAWFKHWFSLPLLKRESVEMAKAELVEHVRLIRENDGKDYMHGYCHVWALKDIQKHPERKIYARVGYHYDDDSEEVDHIFTVDSETGKAYDVRGEFNSIDALLADYEYGADEVDVQEITRADIDDLCRSGELKKYNNKELSESTKMSGKELFNYFQTSHSHEPDNNQNMKKFMLSHNWELRNFTPDMFPSEEDFFDYDDPFDRVIDIDTEHRVDLSQPVIVGPQYSDGKYSVIDGNHRAAAAQRMGKTIKGYFPVQLDENFKDGKKPGRKGLAKRMGVDCSKPVGELRKIAKNSSGEKQRMAHWCANMKGGKKK